ncbi:reverse transcriptase domain-containing protein [Tanacetum coccineum]
MKLNLKKCLFGVEEGKFLGYMVTSEGIRANPKKKKAVADMQSPKTLRQMQSLSGKLAALNLFLARSPWPFYQWGLDILGHLPKGLDKVKFIIVAINYFTKWMEAKPLAKTTDKELVRKAELMKMNTAVAHPQANGLVERANKSLMHGLKARLGRERAGWVDELPNVLWAHRTMLKTSNRETPFSLIYGSKAVIPAKIEGDGSNPGGKIQKEGREILQQKSSANILQS